MIFLALNHYCRHLEVQGSSKLWIFSGPLPSQGSSVAAQTEGAPGVQNSGERWAEFFTLRWFFLRSPLVFWISKPFFFQKQPQKLTKSWWLKSRGGITQWFANISSLGNYTVLSCWFQSSDIHLKFTRSTCATPPEVFHYVHSHRLFSGLKL